MARKARETEMQAKTSWVQAFLTHGAPGRPFSFRYGGASSAALLERWSMTAATSELDADRTQHTLTWTDTETDLEVRCVAVDYADFPVIEWTLYLRNRGTGNTPILEQIQVLDLPVPPRSGGDVILHHNRGDTCGPDAYEPLQQVISHSSVYHFAPVGGRPTSLAFPYFTLQHDGGGMIIALGWPGQWSACFACDDHGALRMTAGQELTHFTLFPGEEVRTPLAVLMFWEGDHDGAQNLWRQWMLTHNLPRRRRELPPPMSAMCRGLHQNEVGEKTYIDLLTRHDVTLDYWWMDAGWYTGSPGPMGEWTQTGSWEPDRERFPNGIAAVAEYAHQRGMKLMLWFELERVSPGSTWGAHSDWLLALKPEDRRFRVREDIGTQEFTREEAERNQIRDGDRLLNLADPAALQFLTDEVSRYISHWGIDLFRLDFNIAPLLFWRAADASDRQGITENAYVCGLLRFLDTLSQRHPDLLIDSCASGGRRVDLETMRRAVVNTRSDYWCLSTTGDQCQTHGIASWLPHYLCAASYDDTYRFHSNLASSMGFDNDVRQNDQTDWALFRRRVADWRRLAPTYSGDYYPLTPWSSRDDVWLAWQFYRPSGGDGVVQIFRRRDNGQRTRTIRLKGLEPPASYEVSDLETGSSLLVLGEKLIADGLTVEIPTAPGSVVLMLRRTTLPVSDRGPVP